MANFWENGKLENIRVEKALVKHGVIDITREDGQKVVITKSDKGEIMINEAGKQIGESELRYMTAVSKILKSRVKRKKDLDNQTILLMVTNDYFVTSELVIEFLDFSIERKEKLSNDFVSVILNNSFQLGYIETFNDGKIKTKK